MIKFRCNKLGRDKSLQRLLAQSVTPQYRMIQGDELRQALQNKLVEEALEVQEAKNTKEIIDEIADVLEVIDGLCKAYSIDANEIIKTKEHKFSERGGFETGFFLESIEMDDGNPKTTYFRAAPHKYPEEKS